MKILCSSDIHSENTIFQNFINELEKPVYDCGILAGDLIDEYPTSSEAVECGIATPDDFNDGYDENLTLDDLEKQIQNVNKMFEDENSVLMKTLGIKRDSIVNKLIKIGKPVFVVLGNHDKINWTTNAPVYNIHQKYVDYQGYRFIGYRYTLMEKSEKEIKEDLKRIIPYINKKTILITHSPPYGILDKTNKGDNIGSKSIRDIITKYKLSLHVFGHVHEDYGNLKNMINASYFVERKFVSVNIN